MGSNGTTNGVPRGGSGGSPPRLHPERANLRMLTSLVNAGQIAADKLPGVLDKAESIVEDRDSSNRDRNAAMSLIAAVSKAGADAAANLDKIERLDKGDPTEGVKVIVEYADSSRPTS